tara:strand:- start:198 stop:410 length:213 start_codon:yes stop_codon:yes gene_type:complete
MHTPTPLFAIQTNRSYQKLALKVWQSYQKSKRIFSYYRNQFNNHNLNSQIIAICALEKVLLKTLTTALTA